MDNAAKTQFANKLREIAHDPQAIRNLAGNIQSNQVEIPDLMPKAAPSFALTPITKFTPIK